MRFEDEFVKDSLGIIYGESGWQEPFDLYGVQDVIVLSYGPLLGVTFRPISRFSRATLLLVEAILITQVRLRFGQLTNFRTSCWSI